MDKNSAWTVMDEIGKLSCLHFVDANSKEQLYNRTYSSLIRRCDEAQHRIKFIGSLFARYHKNLRPPASIEKFLANLQENLLNEKKDAMAYFEYAEGDLVIAERFFKEQLKEAEVISEKYTNVMQHKYVINKASSVILAKAL
jgi:hypothetical protein